MRVLVTGHRGYVGSVLVGVLRHARHDVVGLDCDLYGPCSFGRVRDAVPSFDMDVRDVEPVDLLSFDAMVHLAALPEDPDGLLGDSANWAINRDAAIRLAECCKEAGVGRFLFASTCAVYGWAGGKAQTELGTPEPLTAYARAKLDAERGLLGLADRSFAPVILRNGTVYGVSPALRLDTVVNDFVGSAVARGRVEVQTNGAAWRPFVHVEDVARAYAAVLAAGDQAMGGDSAFSGNDLPIFNVAITEENYRVIDVADLVADLVPGCTRSVRTQPDRRSYFVDGSKLRRHLPGFSWRWTLAQGVRQLRAAMVGAGLTAGEWRSDRYRRVLRVAKRQEVGELDHQVRVARASGVAA